MTELEREAAPVLETLIAGRPIVLDQHIQRTLACWAAKTILMLQAVREPELLPADVFRDLRTSDAPPTGFRIGIGLRPREGRWPYRFAALGTTASRRGWDVGRTYDAPVDHYRAELAIGHLVVRATASFSPHARPIDPGAASIEIWPARVPVRWPPARGLVRIAA
jgi:hypothetical protein